MSRYTAYLTDLLQGFSARPDLPGDMITGLCSDSRAIQSGDLFVALKGARYDARKDASAALAKGAVAVLVDAGDSDSFADALREIPGVIEINDLCAALSEIAGRFYQHPSRKLDLVGITGTNGKTTISYFLAQLLGQLGKPAAVMGTLGVGPLQAICSTGMTTPDAISTQKHLAALLKDGVEVVCMEVSSHALSLGRVAALEFDYAIYSNMSQDHLDFHETMAAYAEAKKRLFTDFSVKHAVINADDSVGRELLELASEGAVSYGIEKGDLRASDIHLSAQGMNFALSLKDVSNRLQSNLIGEFNVYNLLAVAACATAMSFELPQIAAALAACKAVPGRMERVEIHAQQPVVVVDFAHTPDALEKALGACRRHCAGQLAVVFGCGGDRDRGKRPEMGEIAESGADRVFITDDNPRSESPAEIVVDIVQGMQQPPWVVHDRAQAILAAVRAADLSDWVLIAGKGHEPEQIYADQVIKVSDVDLARQALQQVAA